MVATPAPRLGRARLALNTRRTELPAVAALVLVYVVTATWLGRQAAGVENYIWLIDELLYQRQMLGFTDGALVLPEVYGQPHGPYNGLYPMVISPLYALFSSVDAFHLAHVMNALLFASVVFPVYLLARRAEVPRSWAVLAGGSSVIVPWSVATLALMTESVAYPAFVWALLAMVVAVSDPRPRHDALALLAIGVAAYARTQFIVLVAIFVLAIVMAALAAPPGTPGQRERLRQHLPLAVVLLVGALVLFASSRSGVAVLGAYQSNVGKPLFPFFVWTNAGRHAGHLVVGVGIVPVILWVAWLARTALQPRGDAERALAIVGALCVVVLVYMAGAYSEHTVTGRLQERYVFYVVPLFFVAAASVLGDRRRPAPRLTALLGAAVAAGAVAAVPFGPAEAPSAFDTVASAGAGFGDVLEQHLGGLLGGNRTTGDVLVVIALLLGPVVLVALHPVARRIGAPALALAVVLFCALETRSVHDEAVAGINATWDQRLAGPTAERRDWVDAAVPDGESVAMLEGGLGLPEEDQHWMWTEFWNVSIDRKLSLPGRSNYSGFPARELTVDRESGALAADGLPRYLVASEGDPSVGVAGRPLRRVSWGVVLLKAGPGGFRARHLLTGGRGGGVGVGLQPHELRVFDPSARSVRIELAPEGEPRRVVVDARSSAGGRPTSVPANESATLTIPLGAPGTRPRVVTIRGDGPGLAMSRVTLLPDA